MHNSHIRSFIWHFKVFLANGLKNVVWEIFYGACLILETEKYIPQHSPLQTCKQGESAPRGDYSQQTQLISPVSHGVTCQGHPPHPSWNCFDHEGDKSSFVIFSPLLHHSRCCKIARLISDPHHPPAPTHPIPSQELTEICTNRASRCSGCRPHFIFQVFVLLSFLFKNFTYERGLGRNLLLPSI